MAKNRRRKHPLAVSVSVPPLFSRRGKKLMAAGAFLVFAGFMTLSWTDPAGQNWASMLSPCLLIVGYLLIGIGIVATDPVPLSASSSHQS